MDTKNKIIILRKFGIRFLEGKKGSGSVGAIRTCTTNQRYFKSILFNHKIIAFLHNKTYAEYAKNNGLEALLNSIHSNIFLDNLNYMAYLSNLPYIEQKSVQAHIKQLEREKKQKEQAFSDSVKRRVGTNTEPSKPKKKKSAKERRDLLMYNSTLETLKRKDCYLFSHNQKTNTWEFVLLDVLNNQNLSKIVENIAVIYYVLTDLNVSEFNVNIGIMVWEDNAKDKILNDLNKNLNNILSNTYKITNVNWLKSVNAGVTFMSKNYLGNVQKINH